MGAAPFKGAMKRLTPTEWASNRTRTINFNVASGSHAARSAALAWIDHHPGASWVYVMGDNFHFASEKDAVAFRSWLMAGSAI